MSSSSVSTPKQKGDLYLASSLCDGLEDYDLKQVTTLLKNKEADPNVLMPLHGITPFHLVIGNESEAFAEEVTKLFLRHGGNPNVKSNDGMTPVHVAAAWGRTTILNLLLANGGDPLCLDADNCTPFHYAFQGEHYEAVSILSKYCTDKEDEDGKPKFRRELDKVLVNNGDILAEYIVSEDPTLDSSSTSFQCNSNDAILRNSDFVTVRKTHKKRVAQNNSQYTSDQEEDRDFNFKRETMEEEKNLIHEIISQLSSTINSDKDDTSALLQNYENECLLSYQKKSPKRKQIIMTFNRPKKRDEHIKQFKKETNRRISTLQVIKQHKHLPNVKNNKIFKDTVKKSVTHLHKHPVSKSSQSTKSPKVIKSKTASVPENILFTPWLNETIISKSPNLAINTNSSKNRKEKLNTSNFKTKDLSTNTKSKITSNIVPNKVKSKSQSKLNNYTTVSRIPKPKKYFTTPCHLKRNNRTIETPTKTVTPQLSKVSSLTKSATEGKLRSRHSNSWNTTFTKSESTSSVGASRKKLEQNNNRRESIRNIAVNLDDVMYDDEECILEDQNSNELFRKDSNVSENRYRFSSERELTNLTPEYELISGVGVLHSNTASNTNSKSDMLSCTDDAAQKVDENLNQARFNMESNQESRNNKFLLENSAILNPDNTNDSLECIRGSYLPDLNDSSVSPRVKQEAPSNLNNDIETAEEVNPIRTYGDSNSESFKDQSSCQQSESEAYLSFEEEYKYEDVEEGIAFLERRLCVTPPCTSSDTNSSFYSCNTVRSEPLPKELFLLDSATLRQTLKTFGENPGPITNTTHHLYLKRLHKLQKEGGRRVHLKPTSTFKSRNFVNIHRGADSLKSSLLSIEWIKDLDDYEAKEQKIFLEFATPNPSRKWREGTCKSSFNYLLLDPRITDDLPRRAANLSMSEKWETFLSAIFYVGKGKRSRPYAHLYDAFKIWVSKDDKNLNSRKIQRILDIWNEGRGVVVLHVFHNTIPVEAYTREAMMIEVLGTQKLGNCKAGDYYGVASTWRSKEKCEMGRYLLFKALQILLYEGERQIFPDNL